MSESNQLYCTYDADGGMNVLESFDNEADARVYWQEQIDTADFDPE